MKQKRIEKQLEKVLKDLKKVMENYPNGTITDVIGANVVYKLMNRACVLARKAGYTYEQIEDLLKQAKNPNPIPSVGVPTPIPSAGATVGANPVKPGSDIQF